MTTAVRAIAICLFLLAGTPFARATQAADSKLTGVSLLRSGERVSVAVGMTTEPQKVVLRNVAPTIIEVEVGPISGRVDTQQLIPGSDVPFVTQVSLKEVTAAHRRTFVRLRMTLKHPSRSNVRVVGGTVYVDFSELPRSVSRLPSRQALTSPARQQQAPVPPSNEQISYRQAVDAPFARLAEVGPFLMSAVGTPSPDVLAAVGQTLEAVHDSLRKLEVPSDAAPAHSLLTSAVALATRSVAADFAGDRVAQARRALELVDDAKALMPY